MKVGAWAQLGGVRCGSAAQSAPMVRCACTSLTCCGARMRGAGLAGEVEGAALQRKVENDVHCDYQRASWSALYHRALGLDPSVLHRLESECAAVGGWGARRRRRCMSCVALACKHCWSWQGHNRGQWGGAGIHVFN